MAYTGNYVADFEIWKSKLPYKEKEDLIKELNGDWSAIYKAWNYRFKQEVWFPYKLSLGKQGYSFLIKTKNRTEYISDETKHSRAQPSLMTTDQVIPDTEAGQDGDFYPGARVQERNG